MNSEELKRRVIELAPCAEQISAFVELVRDLNALRDGGDTFTTMIVLRDKILEATSCAE